MKIKKARSPVDPKRVFETAGVFRTGSLILASRPDCMFPMVTCSSFSFELYLKCLLIEGGESDNLHDLEKLFFRLTPESQKTIRTSYEPYRAKREAMYAAVKGVPAPPTDFDFVLRASAKAFEHFRYAFEGLVQDQEGWLAVDICECVRERILERRPDWKI